MSLLHVFDMDGTLLRNTTASLEVARKLGCLSELGALEASFAGMVLDTKGFARALCHLWRDLTAELVEAAFAEAPWIDGIAEVLADIRARGERSAVITMSPDFFAVGLHKIGADDVVASAFPTLPLRGELDPAGILTPASKVTVVERLRARHGLRRDQCIAYGDSLSDVPLFTELTYTVAVNADEHLAERALLRYRGNDLREAYRLARARLDENRRSP